MRLPSAAGLRPAAPFQDRRRARHPACRLWAAARGLPEPPPVAEGRRFPQNVQAGARVVGGQCGRQSQ